MTQVFERYFTAAEEKQLFRHVGQYADIYARRDYQWMIVLRQTGVRIQAFSKLTCHDAREAIRSRTLTLSAAIQKRKRGHQVAVNSKARAALKTLLAIRREMGYVEQPDAPLVPSRKTVTHGRGMSVRSYQSRMQHWCEQAGLDINASPHWFRHTLAKRLIASSESRDPLGIVQAALGHVSRSNSAIYAMPDRESVRDAMEAAA